VVSTVRVRSYCAQRDDDDGIDSYALEKVLKFSLCGIAESHRTQKKSHENHPRGRTFLSFSSSKSLLKGLTFL
jgi:hypothetical protein